MSRNYGAALVFEKVDEKSVAHLLVKKPKKVTALVDPLLGTREEGNAVDNLTEGAAKRDMEIPGKQLVAADIVGKLKNKVASMKKAHREEVFGLKETIAHTDLKYEALKDRYMEILKETTKAVESTRDMLSVTVSQNLLLRSGLLRREDQIWAKEKDVIKAVWPIKRVKVPQSYFKEGVPIVEASEAERELKERLARTEMVLEKSKLLKIANSRMLELDNKCRVLEDAAENLKKSHNSTVAALKHRNEILEKRCEKSEQRRKLDNAGFRQELDELKYLLKKLEKNISKSTKAYADLKKMRKYPKPSHEELRQIVKSGLQQQRVLSGANRRAGDGGNGSERAVVAASNRGCGCAISNKTSRGSGGGTGATGGDKLVSYQPPRAKKSLLTGGPNYPQVNPEAAKLMTDYVNWQIKYLEKKKIFNPGKNYGLNEIKVVFKNQNMDKHQSAEEIGKPAKTQKTLGDDACDSDD